MPFCKIILVFVRGLTVSRVKLSLELLALRQQLVVLRRTVGRPQIQNRDRWFWIVVSRIWKHWRQAVNLRQARNGDQMASPGLQDVLAALEVQIEPGRTSQAG
jgi:hypothetical protein